MTKKHFIALAKYLYDASPNREKDNYVANLYLHAMTQWEIDCLAIADVCKQFNPAFDRERFLSACRGEN